MKINKNLEIFFGLGLFLIMGSTGIVAFIVGKNNFNLSLLWASGVLSLMTFNNFLSILSKIKLRKTK